jgi:three-Cys-motif partner protein
MSKKQSTVWLAPPHTIAKIEILRSYLFLWFSILGSRFAGRDLWYIDGFSGPGEYTNSAEGSPIAALKAAQAALDQTTIWRAGNIHFLFIEEDAARHRHLELLLQELELDARIRWRTYNGTFVEGLDALKAQPVNPFSKADPVFSFIDPFGAKGLSFAAVADLLARPACEVLVNLDSDGIYRIYNAGDNANHRELLNDVFGDGAWESELAAVTGDVPRSVLAHYKRRLKAVRAVRYAFAFEMRSVKTSINYHLVFASQHPLGLEKMKGVMKRLDQDGTYSFSSSNVGQQQFRFDDPRAAALQMIEYFAGRRVGYADVHDYALNESPFINPKAMLKVLESEGRLSVHCDDIERRKGTFPERLHEHLFIEFSEYQGNG